MSVMCIRRGAFSHRVMHTRVRLRCCTQWEHNGEGVRAWHSTRCWSVATSRLHSSLLVNAREQGVAERLGLPAPARR